MKNIYIILLILGFSLSSCEEYLKQTPVDLIGDENVVEDLASLEALILGAYSSVQVGNQYGELIIFMPAILSDEMVFTGTFPTKQDMSVNNVTSENVTMRGVWSAPYTTIFIANTVIERAANAADDPLATQADIDQIVAEAKFLKALCHLNLVQLWGDIPYADVSDVNVTAVLPRESKATVYQNIITLLTEAIPNLPDKSVNGTYRATQVAAQALLARTYLWSGDVANAGTWANTVISNADYSLDPSYANIFDQTSSSDEIIFAMFASVQDGNNLGFFAQPVGLGGRYDYSPNPTLLAAMDAADTRAALIVPNVADATGILVTDKYTDATNGTDEPAVIRLAEMYLIRAEANSDVADLNVIAERATGIPNFYASYTLDNMLQERKFELAFEGHRWHDIIRTGQADAIMSAVKPASWTSTDVLLPIPQRELDQNPTLTSADQNPVLKDRDMKIMNIKHKTIIMSLLAILFITSCDKENGRVTWSGSYVEFDEATSGAAYLRTNDGLNVPGELQINLVAAPSSSAITVNVEVDAEMTTAIAGVHYNDLSGGTVTIAAGSNFGYVPFEVIDDNIAAGEKWLLAYKITGASTDLGPALTNVHSIEVSCLLSADKTAGDWVLDMQDSYGDGWNGASVTFEVDGVGTDYDLDTYTSDGATATTTITVPDGTQTLKFFWNPGDWDSEITFQITAPNGAEVGSYGPTPAAGEFEVNNCLL